MSPWQNPSFHGTPASKHAVIEEMLLSEKVWIKQGVQTLPVIPQSKSLQYKTDINDKVQINYSFDFEFAFNKINLVR